MLTSPIMIRSCMKSWRISGTCKSLAHEMAILLETKPIPGLSLLLGDSRYIGKKTVKHCLNARAKMTGDRFDDERLLARKINENKMKNG